MNNVIIVLPENWELKRVRYVQAPVSRPVCLDADAMPTPLETTDSYLDYQQRAVAAIEGLSNRPSKEFTGLANITGPLDRSQHSPEWEPQRGSHFHPGNQMLEGFEQSLAELEGHQGQQLREFD